MEKRHCIKKDCINSFFIPPSREKKYCSHKCYSDDRIGKKRPEHGDKIRGSKNGRWLGGRIIDKDGYVLIISPDHPNKNAFGYVREHRLVVEKKIGRYLKRNEIVHHIDGNKQNNDISNLKYMSKSEHDSLSMHERWAKKVK
ncbi:MAG: HNH endonuclease [Candidatus Scalindua sp.]|jgi:hypothetical protein|nr:HNH endonuclease [Candidatus Scalindua sp.]